MKKLLLTSILILSGLFFASCAGKKAFEATEVKSSESLIYIYVLDGTNEVFDAVTYSVLVNGNLVGKNLKIGEYLKLDVKPKDIEVSLTRQNLEKYTLELNLKPGKIYYLRGQSQSVNFGDFNFELVNETQGAKEISKAVSATEYMIEGDILDAFVKPDKKVTSKMSEKEVNTMIEKKLKAMNPSVSSNPQVRTQRTYQQTSKTSSGSKLDDIKEAYNMKKQGLLSNEEFKAMKAEILAK